MIAKKLNSKGIVSPSGGQWGHDAVRLILWREAYVGVVNIPADESKGNISRPTATVRRPSAINKGAKGRCELKMRSPGIVDRATLFDAVQAMKAKPFSHCRNGDEGAPLAGLLYCGCCGRVMYAQSLARKAGQKFPNYICSTYHKGHGCGCCFVPQGAIFRAVTNLVRDKVLHGSLPALEDAVAR